MIGRKIDYTSMSKLPNIDTMCDVLSATQVEMGIDPYMKEAAYGRDGKKITRFRRCVSGEVIDNRTGKPLDKNVPRNVPVVVRDKNDSERIRTVKHNSSMEPEMKTDTTPKPDKKKKSLREMGFDEFYNRLFGVVEDDDNDEYICDYCTELGYNQKYKPYICDNCTKCESCSEFLNGSCDGCTYSKTRTGRLYSESLTKDQIVDSDDLDILEESGSTVNHRKPMGQFSTLNY